MTDIIIYTTPEKLLHKQGKLQDDEDYSDTGVYYWKFGRSLPKYFKLGDRVYFATKGIIRGYFVSDYLKYPDIGWNCDSWTEVKNQIPITHFQGFKYKSGDFS